MEATVKPDPVLQNVTVTASRLVSLAMQTYRKTALPEGIPVGKKPASPLKSEWGTEEPLSFTVKENGISFTVTLSDCAVGESGVTLVRLTEGEAGAPPELLLRHTRGVGMCALYALHQKGRKKDTLRLVFRNEETGEEAVTTEKIDASALLRLADKLFPVLTDTVYPALVRQKKRLPTLRELRFPLPEMREGQRDLIEAAETAFHRKQTLYACAPTGTGKTLAALYPALCALGRGEGEKIFYFTPKSTGALAAKSAVELFTAQGAEIRAVIITAKAKICKKLADCRQGDKACRFLYSEGRRETRAALRLLSAGIPVVTPELLQKTAEEEKVCPYELTLRYAEMCDLVICDYNYLFDRRAYLRRFFDTGGDYLYLIDEAHALVERTHEMYSAEWTLPDFDELLLKLPKECQLYITIYEIRTRFLKALLPYTKDSILPNSEGEKEAFVSLAELPADIYTLFGELLRAVERACREKPTVLPRELLKRYFYRVSDVTQTLAFYNRKYRSFITLRGRFVGLRLFCLDASDIIANRLSTGRSAFFFSGTLLPIDYYKTVLGGDTTAVSLVAESPFEKENCAIAVLDRLSVRLQNREAVLPPLLQAIHSLIQAKTGNYMVFCPSYAYMETLFHAFTAAYPRLRAKKQEAHMSDAERRAFLSCFEEDPRASFVGFAVSGGIFAEGIDLVGTRLVGAAVIGVGLPTPTPERDAIAAYYDERFESGREYAYIYPGLNRVLQAGGRVIRRESDRGVILLIDDRLSDPAYKRILPHHWRGLRFVGDTASLTAYIADFWRKATAQEE